jgi:hypothetical protein
VRYNCVNGGAHSPDQMMSASIEFTFQLLSFLFDIAVTVRVIQLGLYRVYPFFFGFLCIPLIPQLALLIWGTRSRTFAHVWLYAEPVRNIFYILVVWELFSVIFRNYAGLRSLSRWVMGVAAAIAPVGLVLTFAASESRLFVTKALVVIRFERGIAFGLVIFIVILLYFISRYPIRLPRNNVVHAMLYSAWFLGDAAILLLSSFVPKAWGYSLVNAGLAMLEVSSYIGWAVLLSKTGEYQETRVRQNLSPEREQILIGQLNSMNEVLLRAGRTISHSS